MESRASHARATDRAEGFRMGWRQLDVTYLRIAAVCYHCNIIPDSAYLKSIRMEDT